MSSSADRAQPFGASSRREWAGIPQPFKPFFPDARLRFYPEQMLDLGGIDVEEIATALADQTDCERRWLIDPGTGEVAFWTSDTGIDGLAKSVAGDVNADGIA